MAIATVTQRNALVDAYKAGATHAALYTTVPSGSTPGTEVTGGSPAYARKPANWGATAASAATASPAAHDVPTGVTIAGAGFHDALTAGNYRDGGSVPSQPFSSQGTYTLTATFTQT